MIFLRTINNYRCDVLIYDSIGEQWLRRCVPQHLVTKCLDIRKQKPVFLRLTFFLRIIGHYLHYRHLGPSARYLAYISAVLNEINPPVIVSFADNNTVLGEYADRNPATLVISIQNALRDTIGSIPHNTKLPVYYALGQAERPVFRDIGVSYQDYIPIGSLKLGLALEKYGTQQQTWDIAFCSHYRPDLVKSNATPLLKKIELAQRDLFKKICQYVSTSNLSLVVLSKMRELDEQEKEQLYYKDIAVGVPFVFIRADKIENELETYKEVLSSDLIVNLCSTLAYEAFGAGKKVLFANSYDKKLISEWGIRHYYNKLPQEVCVENSSLAEFIKTADYLRKLSDKEYNSLTRDAAFHYLSMSKNNPPHTVLLKRISQHTCSNYADMFSS